MHLLLFIQAADFTPANRITQADEDNDLRSTKRKLDKPLRLITKLKLGKKNF